MRVSREQMKAALEIAKLPDEYFAPIDDIEVVPMTPEELAREAIEEVNRAETDLARRESAARKMRELEMVAAARHLLDEEMEDDEELDDDDFAEEEGGEPPVSVLTSAPTDSTAASVAAVATPRATSHDEPTLDVAEIVRQQTRHDRRKKITPVHPTAVNEEKRRALAAKLFG